MMCAALSVLVGQSRQAKALLARKPRRQVAVMGALFENDRRVAPLAVLTGEVIAFACEAQVAPHLANGRLETVLDDWCPSFPGFHLYYPSRREVTPALRAFIETMKDDG
jgi:DNA-binding transcriptional LysR family regulator